MEKFKGKYLFMVFAENLILKKRMTVYRNFRSILSQLHQNNECHHIYHLIKISQYLRLCQKLSGSLLNRYKIYHANLDQ